MLKGTRTARKDFQADASFDFSSRSTSNSLLDIGLSLDFGYQVNVDLRLKLLRHSGNPSKTYNFKNDILQMMAYNMCVVSLLSYSKGTSV